MLTNKNTTFIVIPYVTEENMLTLCHCTTKNPSVSLDPKDAYEFFFFIFAWFSELHYFLRINVKMSRAIHLA